MHPFPSADLTASEWSLTAPPPARKSSPLSCSSTAFISANASSSLVGVWTEKLLDEASSWSWFEWPDETDSTSWSDAVGAGGCEN